MKNKRKKIKCRKLVVRLNFTRISIIILYLVLSFLLIFNIALYLFRFLENYFSEIKIVFSLDLFEMMAKYMRRTDYVRSTREKLNKSVFFFLQNKRAYTTVSSSYAFK